MSEAMNRRPSRQRSSQGLNNNNKNDDTNSTKLLNFTEVEVEEEVREGGEIIGTNELITSSTTADDHQILAILAHMSQQQQQQQQQQSGTLPNSNRSTPTTASRQVYDSTPAESTQELFPIITPTITGGGGGGGSKTSNKSKSKSKSKSSSPSIPSQSGVVPLPLSSSTSSLTFTSQLSNNNNSTNGSSIASTSTSTSSSSNNTANNNNPLFNPTINTKEIKPIKLSKVKGKSKVIDSIGGGGEEEDQLMNDNELNPPTGSGDEINGGLLGGFGEVAVGGSGGKGKEGAGGGGKEEDWTRTRKDNHKEVERRRRETINEGINDLKQIVPGCEKNKGSILSSAVQYIQKLKDSEASNIEKWTLEKLLSDQVMEEFKDRNEQYRLNGESLELELEVKSNELLEMTKNWMELREECDRLRKINSNSGKRTVEEVEEDEREDYKKQRRWEEMREETM